MSAAARERRLRLQILLLAVLALWLVDRGLTQPQPVPAPDLPAVSSGPPVGSGLAGEAQKSAHELSAASLALLLQDVNPSLGAREALRIASAVLRSSAKYRLDPELVTAILLVESRARPWARSPKGAIGLMQVMPHMLEPLHLVGNPATIETNIEAGCWILASDIRRLGEVDGISSYFWGSEIRGSSYLQKVRAAQAEVRRRVRRSA